MSDIAEHIVLNTNAAEVEVAGVTERVYRLIYKGHPPWEIGKVQTIVQQIAKDVDFRSPVIDVGCGSGCNSYFLAAQEGHSVFAIDYLQEIIELARGKNPHPNIIYQAIDVFVLGEHIKQYNTVLDSATFHGFSDEKRLNYVNLLRENLSPGALIYIIGFSDYETRSGGPRRLSSEIFYKYFSEGFDVLDIWYSDFEVTLFEGSIKAIVAKIRKV